MDFGRNYSAQHALGVEFLKENFQGFDFSDIAWTSDPTPWNGDPKKVQNCFGFAMNSAGFWQPPSIHGDPEGDPRFCWPEKLLKDGGDNAWVSRYVEAAKERDFEECDDDCWEDEFEKIVLIHNGGVFTHAAVQVSKTTWKSKLGVHSDFEHPLECLARKPFGKGMVFMKKRRCRSGCIICEMIADAHDDLNQ